VEPFSASGTYVVRFLVPDAPSSSPNQRGSIHALRRAEASRDRHHCVRTPTMEDLVGLIDAAEGPPKKRGPY
jgi:hypothetical protein